MFNIDHNHDSFKNLKLNNLETAELTILFNGFMDTFPVSKHIINVSLWCFGGVIVLYSSAHVSYILLSYISFWRNDVKIVLEHLLPIL